MPILMMSATCRPVAIEAIKKSLKLPDEALHMLRGELTRPEIRFIRVTMEFSMASCNDLRDLYAPKDDTHDDKVVPTIIYSGTRKRTINVLEVLDRARGTPNGADNPESTFARRFHSITGNLAKSDVATDFGAGTFPVVSATMALGLGQNWSRVRSVIHMGRGDPAAICQMLGRCGRDGRPGVAIMFVEKSRIGGKNNINQIVDGIEQSDDDRMDALAITPVCLRIAFALDTKLGYIPMSVANPGYQREKAREESKGFAQCWCSNCMPMEADTLIENMRMMTTDNVDRMITTDLNAYISGAVVPKRKTLKPRVARPSTKRALADPEDLRLYKKQMRDVVDQLHLRNHGEHAFFTSEQLFQDDKIDIIAHNADRLLDAIMELTENFQRRTKPAPTPKTTTATARAMAATQAITDRMVAPKN
ncbi:hypothetical protein PSTT_04205 [Puccinia striiformis]|uniref:DNA 3'-5' helicase n=1 Tax=Puccinia striiformis TaxID=27350 RepID=A0A2S4VSX1_9BASI|nr:hypothetical protein PSTT_04205 [Puccinia striiformis]